MKFSGLLVNYNEGYHLPSCIAALSFCNEVVVVDLGSQDDSVRIAHSLGARVVNHPHVDIVEQVREFAIQQTLHDWIVFVDPDEVFPSKIVPGVIDLISSHPDIAIIRVPLQYYFKRQPLTYTYWGRYNITRESILNRTRVKVDAEVHGGAFRLQSGYRAYVVERRKDNVIAHYWIDSYFELFEKHLRYLRHEGKALYERGNRFSIVSLFKQSATALWLSLFRYDGWRHGFQGVFLSLFYASYIALRWLSLWCYERNLAKAIV